VEGAEKWLIDMTSWRPGGIKNTQGLKMSVALYFISLF
jgi:hypothetical protein